MKNRIQNRWIPILLCMILALGLTACSKKDQQPVAVKRDGTAEVLSGSKTVREDGNSSTESTRSGNGNEKEGKSGTEGAFSGKRRETAGRKDDTESVHSESSSMKEGSMTPPMVDPEQAEESLEFLRSNMIYCEPVAGAVAYLGYREQGDSTPLSDWLRENGSGLTEGLPFLLGIPDTCVLGAGYGDLYCIVPRNENTSLSVNRVTWKDAEPVTEEVLYREEYAQSVLVFVNYNQSRENPDTEIVLVTDSGAEVTWYPRTDEEGCPVVPYTEDYISRLLDFTFYGDYMDAKYYEGDPPAWYPPTDWGLAYTSWDYGNWYMEMSWGDSSPEYSGIVNLYYHEAEGQEYELAYSGVWRMEEERLRLELSDNAGNSISGAFPADIDSYGEYLSIYQDPETYVCPPFFDEGMTYAVLALTYG